MKVYFPFFLSSEVHTGVPPPLLSKIKNIYETILPLLPTRDSYFLLTQSFHCYIVSDWEVTRRAFLSLKATDRAGFDSRVRARGPLHSVTCRALMDVIILRWVFDVHPCLTYNNTIVKFYLILDRRRAKYAVGWNCCSGGVGGGEGAKQGRGIGLLGCLHMYWFGWANEPPSRVSTVPDKFVQDCALMESIALNIAHWKLRFDCLLSAAFLSVYNINRNVSCHFFIFLYNTD